MTDNSASTWFVLDVLFVTAVVLFAIGFAMKRAHQADAHLVGNTISRRRRRAITASPVRMADRKTTNART